MLLKIQKLTLFFNLSNFSSVCLLQGSESCCCCFFLHVCCSGDTNKVKLTVKEQLYARAFCLRSRRKFDDAEKLQSLVDSLCNGL